MINNAYKSNRSTPSGDSDKPRSFPNSNKPRMFPNSGKRIFPVVTDQEQVQEEKQEVQQDTKIET